MAKKQSRESREIRDRLKAYTARQELHRRQTARRVRDNVIAAAGAVVVAALAGLAQFVYFTAGPGAPEPEPSASGGVSVGVPDPDYSEYRTWTGELVLNDIALGIELDGEAAPQAVAAFVSDVENGYYPGKTCHRLAAEPGFELLQCGSVDGAGGPDPGFSYGPIENAPADDAYPAGTIAIARASGDAYSNGHQFFVVYGDSTIPADAAGGYTVVGRVTSGLDALVERIAAAGVDPALMNEDGTGAPAMPVTITDVAVE